jgi:hypothetical protein
MDVTRRRIRENSHFQSHCHKYLNFKRTSHGWPRACVVKSWDDTVLYSRVGKYSNSAPSIAVWH